MGNQITEAFCKKWMWISFIVFIAAELIVGSVIGEFIRNSYKSQNLRFMIQGLLHISSFFIGGFLIGFFSPGIRIVEPAVGAFLSMVVIAFLVFFTPHYYHFRLGKMLIAGTIAFFLALYGAKLGEKVSGNKV